MSTILHGVSLPLRNAQNPLAIRSHVSSALDLAQFWDKDDAQAFQAMQNALTGALSGLGFWAAAFYERHTSLGTGGSAGLVGALDGDLAVGQVLDALATLLGSEPAAVREAYLPVVRDLLAEGFLTGG